MTEPIVYFGADGHLTDQGLAELADGCPDELTRLEIAEHLSFCDACTDRYTLLLSGQALLCPPALVTPAVMARIRKRCRILFMNRFMRVGVAACLAIVLWLAGVRLAGSLTNQNVQGLPEAGRQFAASITKMSDQVCAQLNSFFSGFHLGEAGGNEKEK